jgi:hypothetical protein
MFVMICFVGHKYSFFLRELIVLGIAFDYKFKG